MKSVVQTCCVLLLTFVSSQASAAERPNIVLIIADDLGYGDLACYGCPDTKTPVLDRLAAGGVRFTNYYANAPECTPTRTALMTGRYQQRVGGLECAIGTGNVGRYGDAIRLAEQHELGLPPEENTLTRGLNQAGYTLVGFGKWHLGYEPTFWPLRHGFDKFFGPLGGGVDYYYHVEWDGTRVLHEDDQLVARDGYMTDLITSRAVAFLKQADRQRPFFLYLPYTAPHTPLQAPGNKPEVARSKDNWNEGSRTTYIKMVERLDQGIGDVLNALKTRGLAGRETLIVFFSDNGGTRTARNAPFSGYKGGLFEGGIHVPCIVRWPGVLPEGNVCKWPTITFDLTRSLLRVAGAKVPKGRTLDGVDILARIENDLPFESRTLFWRQRRGDLTWRAVRDGSMKYLSRQDSSQKREYVFDLVADPAESENLLSRRPQEAARLRSLLTEWETAVQPGR